MYLISRIGAFRDYYAPYALFGLPIPLLTFLDLFGWEFLFRGFLLFALVEICGPYAILLQAVPFTIAHIGKPAIETYSCIIGGTLFGLVAYRTKSFIYPFLIHWMIASSIIYFSLGK
jgi:membrane protease YdiL (CAAX protease family)